MPPLLLPFPRLGRTYTNRGLNKPNPWAPQVSRNYKATLSKLVIAARTADAELFALMLSEKAHRVHGRYTDAYQRLHRALKDAEEVLKNTGDE